MLSLSSSSIFYFKIVNHPAMYITTRAPALHEMKIPFRVEHFSEIQNFVLLLLLIIKNAYFFFESF